MNLALLVGMPIEGLHPERLKAVKIVHDMMIARARLGDTQSYLIEKYAEHLYDDEKVEDLINHRIALMEAGADEIILLFEVARKIAEA